MCSSDIIKYVAFLCISQEVSETHFLGSDTELTTSLNTFAWRLASTVALEMELKFGNLTDGDKCSVERKNYETLHYAYLLWNQIKILK